MTTGEAVCPDEQLSMAKTLLNMGSPKGALAHFREVLKVDPAHVKANIGAGNVLGKLARYEQAIWHYDAVLEQSRDNPLALINKGLALHFLGDFSGAIKNYDAVLGTRPSNPTVLYNKASSLAMMGKANEALDALRQAVEADDSFREKANLDADFDGIRTLNEFKRIVL